MGMFVAAVLWTLITFSWMLFFEADFTTEVIRMVKSIINSRQEAIRAKAAMVRAAQFSAVTAAEEASVDADHSARVAHAHVVALVATLAMECADGAHFAAATAAQRARRSITDARQMNADIVSGKKLKPLKRMTPELVIELRSLRARFKKGDEATAHLMQLHKLKARQAARTARLKARKHRASGNDGSVLMLREPTYFEQIRLDKVRRQEELVALRDRYVASARNHRAIRRIADAALAKEEAAAAGGGASRRDRRRSL